MLAALDADARLGAVGPRILNVDGSVYPSARTDPGLFVFGPDRSRIRRLRYLRAARAIRSKATTLVWLAE